VDIAGRPFWSDSGIRTRRLAVSLVILVCSAVAVAQDSAQKSFATPEEAAQALVDACAVNDVRRLSSILGPSARELLSSGGVISEKVNRKNFALAYEELNRFAAEGEARRILHVGQEEWPFPIPIVQHGNVWFFETLERADELLRRRIAGNDPLR